MFLCIVPMDAWIAKGMNVVFKNRLFVKLNIYRKTYFNGSVDLIRFSSGKKIIFVW